MNNGNTQHPNLPVLSSHNLPTYVKGVIVVPDLTAEEEKELLTRFRKNGDKEAAKKLITANLKLVVRTAYRFRNFRDVSDLIQEGNVGLMTALKKFDLEKNVRFVTYASLWIKAKIQEFILSHMSIVTYGKSRDERKLFYNLAATIKEIEQFGHDHEMTDDELIQEISKRLRIDPSKIRENIKMLRMKSDLSIDAEYGSSGAPLLLEDHSHDLERNLIDDDCEEKKREALAKALAELNDRERFVIEERFFAENPRTLQEIGEELGVSKERIRQIEAKAMEKIRDVASQFINIQSCDD